MPSQNLPKPNIPGQTGNQAQSPSVINKSPSVTNKPPSATSQAPSVSSQPTSIFPKTTPGVSSRENPAGRPPAKPTLTPGKSLTDPTPLKASTNDSQSSNTKTTNDKVAMPGDLNPTDKTMKVPQPNFPNKAELNSKPVITPRTLPLGTSAGVSAKDLNSTKPTSPPPPPPPPPSTQKMSAPAPQSKKMEKSEGKKAKFSLPKPVLIIVAVLALVVVAFIIITNLFAQRNTPTPVPEEQTSRGETPPQTEIINITYWGLWEDGEILSDIFSDFQAQEGIRVDYRKQSHRDYRERLEQALLSGTGPDVFRYHMTWTSMLSTYLSAMPTSIMTSAEYQQTFYPVAFDTLQLDSRIVGIPLMYEGLALFYNREILGNANLNVPTTWSELRGVANQLTVPSSLNNRRDDNITQAGLAIGNASNVDHFADILALLILQNGGNPGSPTTKNVEDALTFYTNFIKQDKVWSNNLPNSTMAFARGEVAMIFAPSWRALDVKEINPELDFGIASVPQLSSEENITWATFWAEGVNKNSTKQEAAWKLLKYLSSPEILRRFYNNASLVRPFGNVYPRIDMANELSEDPLLAPFIADARYAQSFPMASRTHDNGINDQIIQYYSDAINAVLAGTRPDKALQEISAGINQVLKKYGAN